MKMIPYGWEYLMEADPLVSDNPLAPFTDGEEGKWRGGVIGASAVDAGRLVATMDALRAENTLLRKAAERQRETLSLAMQCADRLGEELGGPRGHSRPYRANIR